MCELQSVQAGSRHTVIPICLDTYFIEALVIIDSHHNFPFEWYTVTMIYLKPHKACNFKSSPFLYMHYLVQNKCHASLS